MSRFVRSSKVRHVYVEPAKLEKQYQELRISLATGDQNYIKANTKFFAYPVQTGGGALTVVPLDQVGKLPPCLPVYDGHVGAVLDFDFNPFHEHVIASGGDDCTVKVWRIPDGGLTQNIMDPLVNMAEHQKKVVVVRFHPTADSILATGSADHTVKIWDATRGDCRATCEASRELIQDVVWNYDGSLLASSSKDKILRVIDPRTAKVAGSVLAHDGTKTSKLVFLGPTDRLCSVGFTRTSKRQFKIWDPRQLAKPITVTDVDQGSGVIMPFFDEDTNLLFLGGKGDGNIRYYEITDSAPFQYHINEFRAASPARGLALVPKLGCDTSRCEVAKILKLTKNSVEPLSFIVPRKSEMFQPDLYPDCYAGRPSLSAEEFFAGKNAKPLLTSMDPSKRATVVKKAPSSAVAFKVSRSAKELEAELSEYKKYVELLQHRLKENNIAYPPPATVA
mmetsp:Transcript_3711/g.10772  ORF Transcript_3711/g.10772 Transcript_3711/m.10772 type:complete len:449 (+) Transcript_3711:159-1505(+)|eukprot:CAMPEP_0202089910 /NCGR_PEP_ID=MMETSP0964-20121228/42408_1 /ASSEMBLY_ACC=CAM_ASM_000500 /TAXON_ID=4773 /ORGANISM="Schizochytrium aggregatum, Strain ATCC28209" /LENGTH=448 /DNA_ID=CAMNT_0048658037 /DNA_START=53 /DNA_END=1399 /DNA_ORIENTATION=+